MVKILDSKRLVRDAMSATAMKSAGELYLPKLPGQDDVAYEKYYHFNADFPLIMPEAVNAMLGMAFRKEPDAELGKLNEELLTGSNLTDFSRGVLRDVLLAGCGVLVDYSGDHAQFVKYDQQDVQKLVTVGNEVAYVKLADTRMERKGRGEWESVTEYLHYEMVDGVLECWRTDSEDKLIEEIEIRGVGGVKLDQVPFVFFSSTQLNKLDDLLPLEELAMAARKWYFWDAELSWDLFMQKAQAFVTNVEEAPNTIGGGTIWSLQGHEVQVGYIQPDPEGFEVLAAEKAVCLERMHNAAAKVLDVAGAESGKSRQARQSDQRATLAIMCETTSQGITRLLKLAAKFEAKTEEVYFDISKEFEVTQVDAQMLAKLLDATVAQQLPQQMLFEAARKTGITDLTDDEIVAKLTEEQTRKEAFSERERSATESDDTSPVLSQ